VRNLDAAFFIADSCAALDIDAYPGTRNGAKLFDEFVRVKRQAAVNVFMDVLRDNTAGKAGRVKIRRPIVGSTTTCLLRYWAWKWAK